LSNTVFAHDPTSLEARLSSTDGLVLVAFAAAGCAPCAMMRPVLQQLAAEWSGRLVLVEAEADRLPELTHRLHVYCTPTMVFFKQGRPVARLVGVQPLRRFEEVLTHLST